MKTVLIVDDDKTFSGLLKTVFELEGYQAVVLPSPDEVLPTVRQMQPALLLMDVYTTGRKDTFHVLRELRADESSKSIPVVMVSGMDRSEECLACGADRFLLKPFRPSELLAIVSGLINP